MSSIPTVQPCSVYLLLLSFCLFVRLWLRSSSTVLCSNSFHRYIHPELTCIWLHNCELQYTSRCCLLMNCEWTSRVGTHTRDTFAPFVHYIDLSAFFLPLLDSRSLMPDIQATSDSVLINNLSVPLNQYSLMGTVVNFPRWNRSFFFPQWHRQRSTDRFIFHEKKERFVAVI